MKPFVITHDPRRAELWRNLFGAPRLPVKAASPRYQYRLHEPVRIYAYDLDASRLTDVQRYRFAAYVARRMGISYARATHLVDGWPIEADDCEIETAVPGTAVSLLSGVFACEPFARAMVGA